MLTGLTRMSPRITSYNVCYTKLLRYNFDAAPTRYGDIARVLGGGTHPDAAAGELKGGLMAAIARLRDRLGIVGTLGDLGVKPGDLAFLSGMAALDPCLLTNPRAAMPQDLAEIYANAI